MSLRNPSRRTPIPLEGERKKKADFLADRFVFKWRTISQVWKSVYFMGFFFSSLRPGHLVAFTVKPQLLKQRLAGAAVEISVGCRRDRTEIALLQKHSELLL